MTMRDGKKNDRLTVVDITSDAKVKKRLQDMGLIKGTQVQILGLHSNNAYIINVRGARVAISKEIASQIIVDPPTCDTCLRKSSGL